VSASAAPEPPHDADLRPPVPGDRVHTLRSDHRLLPAPDPGCARPPGGVRGPRLARAVRSRPLHKAM